MAWITYSMSLDFLDLISDLTVGFQSMEISINTEHLASGWWIIILKLFLEIKITLRSSPYNPENV